MPGLPPGSAVCELLMVTLCLDFLWLPAPRLQPPLLSFPRIMGACVLGRGCHLRLQVGLWSQSAFGPRACVQHRASPSAF